MSITSDTKLFYHLSAKHAKASKIFSCNFVGFEKMDRGLSERYNDKISPVGRHMGHMVDIGAKPGIIKPYFNAMTSDVIKYLLMLPKNTWKRTNLAQWQILSTLLIKIANMVSRIQEPACRKHQPRRKSRSESYAIRYILVWQRQLQMVGLQLLCATKNSWRKVDWRVELWRS